MLTVQSSEDAVRFIDKGLSPSFVLLDIHLSVDQNADGFRCLNLLRRAGYNGPVFILSGDIAFDQALNAARAGANGYLVKNDPSVFLKCLEKRLHPSKFPESPLGQAAIAYLETRGRSGWDIILLRELAKNFDRLKSIACRLGRSESSVKKQFQSIRNRLDADSQADLSRMLGVLSCFSEISQ